MMAEAKNNILFYFAIVLLIPLCFVVWASTAKILAVFSTHRDDYVVTNATLIENVNRKYGDRATFRINYNGQSITGRDQSLFWASPGDVVKVYFNKKDVYDNGIIRQLITFTIGQWLFFIALVAYITVKVKNNYRKNTLQ